MQVHPGHPASGENGNIRSRHRRRQGQQTRVLWITETNGPDHVNKCADAVRLQLKTIWSSYSTFSALRKSIASKLPLCFWKGKAVGKTRSRIKFFVLRRVADHLIKDGLTQISDDDTPYKIHLTGNLGRQQPSVSGIESAVREQHDKVALRPGRILAASVDSKPRSQEPSYKINKALSKKISRAFSLKDPAPEAEQSPDEEGTYSESNDGDSSLESDDEDTFWESDGGYTTSAPPSEAVSRLKQSTETETEQFNLEEPPASYRDSATESHRQRTLYPRPSPYHEERSMTLSSTLSKDSQSLPKSESSKPERINASEHRAHSNPADEAAMELIVELLSEQERKSGNEHPSIRILNLGAESEAQYPVGYNRSTTSDARRPLKVKNEAVQAPVPTSYHHQSASLSTPDLEPRFSPITLSESKRPASETAESPPKKLSIKPIEDIDCEIIGIVSCGEKDEFVNTDLDSEQQLFYQNLSLPGPLHLLGMGSLKNKVRMNIADVVYTATTDGERVYMLPFIQDQEANISLQQRTGLIRSVNAPGCKISKWSPFVRPPMLTVA